MRFAFTDEQLELQRVVRELLARECPPARVRAAWEPEVVKVDTVPAWRALAGIGVIGMTAPERFGGMGADELDLALVLEEAGRAALPGPIVEHTAVALPLLAEVAGEGFCDRWLGAAAAGRALISVGIAGAPFVPDAARARLLLLEHGGELHAVEPGAAGVTLTAEPSVDGSRGLARVDWQPGAATCIAAGPAARRALERAFDRGAFATAAILVGVARTLLDMTVAYAGMRTQFGKPIGSFQAVKHQLADAHAALELARPCVHRAAHAVARSEPDRAVHVSIAKAYASDAATRAARTALQCHGAIGYSYEYDLHLWMKRAWVHAAAWGDAAWHRARIADHLLGAAAHA